jgi:hypothetical protein
MKRKLQAAVPATAKSAGVVQAKAPARAAGFIADLFVPVLQALFTGLIASGLIAYCIHKLAPRWNGILDLWLFLALVIATVSWICLLVDTRKLLWAVERIFGDLDGDGAKGKPKGNRITLMNPRHAQDEAEERAEKEERLKFKRFVEQLSFRGTAMEAWEKDGMPREVYQRYRDALFAEGYAGWTNGKNDRNGWKLLVPIQEVLDSIVE